ncbi:MAG: hypothetical protein KAZ98_02205 [Prevotella sp.]|nr:hypothetical protein [Prevotella sp.]
MRLYELIQAYDFDEIMPVIADMYPGTAKYRDPLKQAYDILRSMKPVPSKRGIRYKIMPGSKGDEHYVGAEDRDFDANWEVCLGKDVSRDKGVDLNDAELVANCLVNICFLAKHPKAFDEAYAKLQK